MAPIKCRKICVLGYRAVGKTSIIQQYIHENFSPSYDPTIENTFTKNAIIKGQEYELNLIDTAGQDDTSLYPQSYFLGTHGYIIIYSINNTYSFEVASGIYDKILKMTGKIQNTYSESLSSSGSKYSTLPHHGTYGSQSLFGSGNINNQSSPNIVGLNQQPQSSYGLTSYSTNGPTVSASYPNKREPPGRGYSLFAHTPVVLVGNKLDLYSDREITTQIGQKLADSWNAPFFETSAKSKRNIADIFEAVIIECEKADGNYNFVSGSKQPRPKPNCVIT